MAQAKYTVEIDMEDAIKQALYEKDVEISALQLDVQNAKQIMQTVLDQHTDDCRLVPGTRAKLQSFINGHRL